ncbi:MAG: Fic family protein, partial [Acholeplasmatales bacterium]|nr:Fic family protein [Acholeplasmatales bacterium]
SLFDGIFVGGILNIKAGVFRDYNITKSEWVLNGKSVFYSSAKIIMNTLEYDFSLEKKFNYAGLNKEKIVEHIAQFISGIWQIHPFGEGNTRTIAVFTIKYLRTFGFEVNNELFEKNSWYFRNALVRANYSDYSLNIYSTYEYLNRFFANLLLGKNYKLKNRELRLYIKVGNDTVKVGNDTVKDGNDTVKDVNDNVNDTVLSLILKNNKITAIELSNKLNKGIVTIKRELKRLKENNLIERVGSDKTGYWKVI